MIAVDAMGGDFAPRAIVRGVFQAARLGVASILFGDAPSLELLLSECDSGWRSLPISIVHCSEVIEMGDAPSRMVLKKKNSSLVCAMQAVANGEADAVLSAGNSGAAVVAGTLIIGRVPGVLRPALGNFLPTRTGSFFCLDLGATVDSKPDYLEQFALMGSLFVSQTTSIASPRVALLSNGAEPYKGCALVKDTYARLERNLEINFIGNLESRDMFDDKVDVLVCDGFAGNIMLKTMQGAAQTMMRWIKDYAQQSWWHMILLSMQARLFGALKKKLDYAEKGGALLLGLQKPVIVAHGCSSEHAIMNAVLYADRLVRETTVLQFNHELALMIKRVKTAETLLKRELSDDSFLVARPSEKQLLE